MDAIEETSSNDGETCRIELSGTIIHLPAGGDEQVDTERQPENNATVVGASEVGVRKNVTLPIGSVLKKRVETAVLRTQAYKGGYKTLAAFSEGAWQHELQRLAVEFNAGKPFPPNSGEYRRGRPLGGQARSN